MTRPIDLLGEMFSPSYKAKTNGEFFVVIVTPPRSMKLAPVDIPMTAEEFARFQLWRAGRLMIQEAFPDWSPAKREMLQTGLSDDEFRRLTK